MADQYWYPGSGLGDASFTGGPSDSGWQPQNFCYGARITVGGSGGTCTLLGVRGQATSSISVKYGLYDTSGNLLAQATGTVESGAAWRDVTVSVAVAAGDYFVLVSAATSAARWYYNTGGNGSTSTRTFAAAMADPETINAETETNLLYGVRLFVEESAGGGSGTPWDPSLSASMALMGVGR